MTVFDAYAAYYDELYAEKDYAGDINFIRPWLPEGGSILDLGCGTGRHGQYLQEQGFKVYGVDQSAEMIERAKQRMACGCADVRKFKDVIRYDVVISLFHVASYMDSYDDLLSFIESARNNIRQNGRFIFDFWYGPAVLTQLPRVTVKETRSFIRIATPTMDVNTNRVMVDYKIKIVPWVGGMSEIRETHTLRYWFIPELIQMLDRVGFSVEKYGPWRYDHELGVNDWNAYIVARKRE